MPKNTDPAQTAHAARGAPVKCTLDNDPRLFAGAGVIAAYVAQRAGFSEKMQEDVSTAAVEACRETFLAIGGALAAPSIIELGVTGFPDRVEITIGASGGALPPVKSAEQICKRLERALAARVQCEIREGRFCVSLAELSGTGAKA
jgi:anti-sigma regulatory factor (Ser/Thr protein kinase)